MTITVMTEPKSNMAFCKVTEDTGFCISELGVGWIKLTGTKKKGDSIEVPNKFNVEFYEDFDVKTGEAWKKIRFTSK